MSLVSWTQCLCHPTDPLGHVYLLPWDLGSCLASWEHLYPPSCACCCCHPHRSMSPQHGSPGRPLEGQGTPRGIEGPPPQIHGPPSSGTIVCCKKLRCVAPRWRSREQGVVLMVRPPRAQGGPHSHCSSFLFQRPWPPLLPQG